MALTPQNNEAFLREVDEELRRDKTERFVRRHGRTVVIVLVLALIALGAGLYWRHLRTQAAGEDAEAMTQAILDVAAGTPAGEAKGRKVLQGLADSSRDGYAVAARMTLADLAMQKGDLKGAAAGYAAVAADGDAASAWRDLATIRQTAAEFDTLPPGTVIARLQSLATPGNAFFGSAGEMTAMALLKQGKKAEAGALFGRVAKDRTVPETLRSRAVQMAGILGVDAVPQAAPTTMGGAGE